MLEFYSIENQKFSKQLNKSEAEPNRLNAEIGQNSFRIIHTSEVNLLEYAIYI